MSESTQAVGAPLERQVRPRFEEWARGQGHHDLTRSELRRDWYSNSYTNDAWIAWQAATLIERERCAGVAELAHPHDWAFIGQMIRTP